MEFLKRFRLLGFLMLAIIAGALLSVALKRIGPAPASDGISWQSSMDAALSQAKATHKILLIDFYADWCEYCQQMEKTSYRDPDVIRLSRDFIMTKVNVDQHQLLTKYFKVDGLPTLVFARPSEGEITRMEGYIPPDQLAHAMTEVERYEAGQKHG